jgi:hypothetical protein
LRNCQMGAQQPRFAGGSVTKITMKPATKSARLLLLKLQALAAAPGQAAQKRIDRLNTKYDFECIASKVGEMFAGTFTRSNDPRPVMRCDDLMISSHIKWAIEESTGLVCLFKGNELFAEATPSTATRLGGIGHTIAAGFTGLWDQFRTFPTVATEDRGLFLRGLYDGMMNQPKPAGEMLPRSFQKPVKTRATRKAVGYVAGVRLHPYSVAVELGKQIRFNVPLPEITQQLEQMKPKEITQ